MRGVFRIADQNKNSMLNGVGKKCLGLSHSAWGLSRTQPDIKFAEAINEAGSRS